MNPYNKPTTSSQQGDMLGPIGWHISPLSSSSLCGHDDAWELRICGPANCHAFVEWPLAQAAICGLEAEVLCGFDPGNAWGVGIALRWPAGAVLRVNVRADHRYGVDDGRRTTLAGATPSRGWTALRLRLMPQEVLAEGAAQPGLWAVLAAIPREFYPGDPCAACLGKMSRWCTARDFHDPGAQAYTAIRNPAAFGGNTMVWKPAPVSTGQAQGSVSETGELCRTAISEPLGSRRGGHRFQAHSRSLLQSPPL